MPLVFQYGSNCNTERLNAPERLSDAAAVIGRAQTVEEYAIAFNVWSQGNGCAAADLVRASGTGCRAWGVLYEVATERILCKDAGGGRKTLEEIEGKKYTPKPIFVRKDSGEEVEATAFCVKDEERRVGLWTSAEYVGHIVKGLRDHDVPEDYVWHVIKRASETNKAASEKPAAQNEITAIRRQKGLLLSPSYGLRHWQELSFSVESDWQRAIDIVEDRIRGRFLRWIDEIVGKEFAGFASLALDCLLIETMHGLMAGTSTRDTRNAYNGILTAPPFQFDEALATAFYDDVRCGIIHDTETRKGWAIRITPQPQIIEQDATGGRTLNRTMFHEAVKVVLEDWLTKLRTGDADLRDKMRQRMDQIIAKHHQP